MVVVGEKYDLFPPIFCVTFIIYGLMHDYFLAKVKLYYYCWWRMWSLLELSIRHEPIVWWDKTLVLTSCIHNRWIVQIEQYGKTKPQGRKKYWFRILVRRCRKFFENIFHLFTQKKRKKKWKKDQKKIFFLQTCFRFQWWMALTKSTYM